MKYTQGKYLVLKKTAIAEQIYDFVILCPDIAKISKVGQFVHVLPDGYSLRRPISICEIDKEKGTLRIVFQVRGDGTEKLAEINEGQTMDIVAPLGQGFDLKTKELINKEINRVIIVGGGIGTPPLLPLAKKFGSKAVVIIGFRNAKTAILEEDYIKTGAKFILCTDDGSSGFHGFVTSPLKEEIEIQKPDAIFACGPTPMLKSIALIAEENDIHCQVSLEERMGCGVGACLVCACKSNINGKEKFTHVCQYGPVYNAKEVVW